MDVKWEKWEFKDLRLAEMKMFVLPTGCKIAPGISQVEWLRQSSQVHIHEN